MFYRPNKYIYIWLLSSMNFLMRPKMLPHSWYLYGFSVRWILWPTVGVNFELWILKTSTIHHIHIRFSHVWIFWCLVSAETWVKDFPHLKHLKAFSVYSAITCKVWLSTEELATLITSETSLSSMNSLMKSKMCFLTKDSSTLSTFVKFLSSMNCLMT